MASLHTAALSSKHAQLDAQLAQETKLPLPDTIRIADLKKQKLRLKEQIIATH